MNAPADAAADGSAPDRGKRADARRNVEAIITAAIRLLAIDPDVSINEIAKAANVGRVTLYGHFESRTALIREVVARAIADTDEALAGIDLGGDPRDALARLLEATWHLTHRYGALVIAASQALPPETVRLAHETLFARARDLLKEGRTVGEFRDDVPLAWQISVIQAILHGASGAVHRAEISESDAPALVRTTAIAAISA